MKHIICKILLCLSLILALSPEVLASTLDTTALTIDNTTYPDKTVVTIPDESGAVLEALHSAGKTAKLAVPTVFSDGETVHVLKDGSTVVEHVWKDGFVQFRTPGAGVYEIRKGAAPAPNPPAPPNPPTPPAPSEPDLDALLGSDTTAIALSQNQQLTSSHSVANGTVISANGKTVKAASGSKTLTAEGSLILKNLNGISEIRLGAGDRITFQTDGTAVISAAMDRNSGGQSVGYGSIHISLPVNGTLLTRTYFLAEGETVTIAAGGTIRTTSSFMPCSASAQTPVYHIVFDDHDNTHQLKTSDTITARCSGLYDYYTTISITLQGTVGEKTLAAKVDGKDVLYVSDVQVREGSTVLTLGKTYLNTLPVGTHTLTFRYNDGSGVTETFHITRAASSADSTNPRTADPMMIAPRLLFLSAAALSTVYLLRKKKYL